MYYIYTITSAECIRCHTLYLLRAGSGRGGFHHDMPAAPRLRPGDVHRQGQEGPGGGDPRRVADGHPGTHRHQRHSTFLPVTGGVTLVTYTSLLLCQYSI